MSDPAILVIGHGSRSVSAVEEFHQVAAQLKQRFPQRLVETGFLEFATPVIATGLEKLIAQGAKDIIGVPGMLMAAGHAKNDIPSEINTLMAANPGVTIRYATELGVDAKMIRAAAARIEEAETQFGDNYERKDTLLMVVGRGASDPDANSNICKITRMLEEGMGFGWATTSFSGVTTPLVDAALERAHGLGFKKVLLFPYFLFSGRLIDRIYQWADDYQAAHPEIQLVKAGYLNDHELVIDTFVEKVHEAEHGTGNMNCQLCQYRVQILGHEHNVGAPQEGHHHHVRGAGTDADEHGHGHHHGHHHHSHS
ncbi:MAG: sirohydrochlorin chelatase [Aquificaceae bacterium]|nr:MAG: sirohydrochlorin chelatase [Aquificaceae bacterium]